MDLKKCKVIAVVGPTAVGKSDYAIELAKQLDGEIINGDSVQIYRDLNIGSAKLAQSQMQGIVHHLIDVRDANQEYTVYEFQQEARQLIAEINGRGRVAIICGGTGLYISAVMFNYKFETYTEEQTKIFNKYNKMPLAQLQALALNIDPKLAEDQIYFNAVRLSTYLFKKEVNLPIDNSGMTPYYQDFQIIGLTMDRDLLKTRINERVDIMFENGLVDEVSQFKADWPSQTAIGYKEVHKYIQGDYDLETCKELIKRNTRRFAKRQYTWFNNKMDTKWYDVKEQKWL